MSTTFEVYPHTSDIPTFGAVLHLAERRLDDRLGKPEPRIELRAVLHAKGESEGRACPPEDGFEWDAASYAWFSVRGVVGGTDAYFDQNSDFTDDYWEQDLIPSAGLDADYIRQCLGVGHHWLFRRSAGQPAIINLAYGYLAAALAELTGGFVFSDDCAWERLPAKPADFLTHYFVPEAALDAEYREWARECLAGIPEELAGREG